MGFGKPKRPMRIFHVVSKSGFFNARSEAGRGKNARQRMRTIHEGNLLSAAAERRVKAYSGAQAVRFLAIEELRRERREAGRMRGVNPYEGTPLDIGPKVLVEEWDEKPSEEEICSRSRDMRRKYWMIDDDDWQEAVKMSIVAVEAIAARAFGKKKVETTEDGTGDSSSNRRGRKRIKEPDDKELMEAFAEELRRENAEPLLPVRPDAEGCGCIFYNGIPEARPMDIGRRRHLRFRSRAKPLPPPRKGPKPVQLTLFPKTAP